MRKYTVYMHENRMNKKKYIGITSRKPEIRWNNGYGYSQQTKFYNSIIKYGWDAFNHYILFTNLSKEEACQKEIELIKKYNSIEFGYNTSSGGEYANKKPSKYLKKIINNFMIIEHKGQEFKLKCLKCGSEMIRKSSTISMKSNFKCECSKPKTQPRHYNYVTYKKQTKMLQHWCNELGLDRSAVYYRLKNGWSVEEAFETPIHKRKNKNCLMCNKEFKPKDKQSKYCSPKCKWESQKQEKR